MNSHMVTKEYKEGYDAFHNGKSNPYAPGSTARALWIEGFNDAWDDHNRRHNPTKGPNENGTQNS